jgi:hypothetical protein
MLWAALAFFVASGTLAFGAWLRVSTIWRNRFAWRRSTKWVTLIS